MDFIRWLFGLTEERIRSDRLKKLGYGRYAHYLTSPHWQKLKKAFWKANKRACATCGHEKGLNIHHKTYVRLGCERLTDLVALCAVCHRDTHEVHKQRVQQGICNLGRAHLELRARRAKVGLPTR